VIQEIVAALIKNAIDALDSAIILLCVQFFMEKAIRGDRTTQTGRQLVRSLFFAARSPTWAELLVGCPASTQLLNLRLSFVSDPDFWCLALQAIAQAFVHADST
jgi:hypothetical protein